MSCCSEDYYSDEEYSYEEESPSPPSESPPSRRRRRRGEAGGKRRRKEQREKERKREKRHRKERERRRGGARRKKDRKRRRDDESDRGLSPPPRAAAPRRRSPPRRRGAGAGGGGGGAGGIRLVDRSPSPGGRDWTPEPEKAPFEMPRDGRQLTIAEACEAAGRGVTTGKTAQDNEVQILDDREEPVNIEPFESFDDAVEFPREIRQELRNAGFPAPSQIQAYTWPLGLKNRDVIGIAATGSGKTLAFLLPAFVEMLDRGHRPEREGPGLLVLSPTRELAQQTDNEAARFGKCLNMRCVAMYGGAPKGQQLDKYRRGVHSIVACPGRLNDYLEGGQVRLESVLKLVLDEADRMLDMGFEPQIRKILAKVPRRRHTMFFTATWPREVRNLAAEILNRPYKVMIGNREVLKGNQDIIQQCRVVDSFAKERECLNLLREAGLLRRDTSGKALIFANTKRMCEKLSDSLRRDGVPCTSIHGDKDQVQRDDALSGLKTGRHKVLCATDVAARGLDIKGVGLVINFDPANNTEDYVHRIGRTGRAGAIGYAVTLLTSADGNKARGIVEVMQRTDQEIGAQLRELAGTAAGGGGRRGRGGRNRGGNRDRDRDARDRSRSRRSLSCSMSI